MGETTDAILLQRMAELSRQLNELNQNVVAASSLGEENATLKRRVAFLEEADNGLAALINVRTKLATATQRLADIESAVFLMKEENARLRSAGARADMLANEINALRYRCEEAERALRRLRQSVSWSLTRPIRWAGRVYNQLVRRSA